MDSVDIEMKDASPFLDTSMLTSTHDNDIRSPRTPTYVPTSFAFKNIQPFDPSSLFTVISPTKLAQKSHLLLPPPSRPLAWVWECHLCRARYPLGVTRRCLVDGHYYCSGEADQPNLKRKKKRQSCSSEFDYVGWKDWNDWRRKALRSLPNTRITKGCEICDFPSQCAYSKAMNVDNLLSGTEAMEVDSKIAEEANGSATEETDVASRYYSNENQTFETLLANDLPKATRNTQSLVQSKVTDYYKPDKKGMKISTSEKTKKARTAHASKKSCLSPIEEELLMAETAESMGLGLQDFVMPIMDIFNDKTRTEKRRSVS